MRFGDKTGTKGALAGRLSDYTSAMVQRLYQTETHTNLFGHSPGLSTERTLAEPAVLQIPGQVCVLWFIHYSSSIVLRN